LRWTIVKNLSVLWNQKQKRKRKRTLEKISLEIDIMTATDPLHGLPDDYVVTSQAFTKQVHRDVYPAIDPSNPALSQKGKVVIITGASKGIGRKVLNHIATIRNIYSSCV
jgi:FlaA1/EpsC-like NDP-sugar epimerase